MRLDKRKIKKGQTMINIPFPSTMVELVRREKGKIERVKIPLGELITEYSGILLFVDEIFKDYKKSGEIKK